MKYKYALFVRKSLRQENVVILNNIFTPLNLNHDHNTCAAINHLLDIPQKQTCHYGTYSMVFTASKIWNDILRKPNKDLLYCELYLVKLQFMVVIKIVHFVFFYQYSISFICSVYCISLSIAIFFFIYMFDMYVCMYVSFY